MGSLELSGRTVLVGCCVLLLVVTMKCGDEITRAYRGVNEDVATNVVRSTACVSKSFRGGLPCESVAVFCCFLLLWSVVEGS